MPKVPKCSTKCYPTTGLTQTESALLSPKNKLLDKGQEHNDKQI